MSRNCSAKAIAILARSFHPASTVRGTPPTNSSTSTVPTGNRFGQHIDHTLTEPVPPASRCVCSELREARHQNQSAVRRRYSPQLRQQNLNVINLTIAPMSDAISLAKLINLCVKMVAPARHICRQIVARIPWVFCPAQRWQYRLTISAISPCIAADGTRTDFFGNRGPISTHGFSPASTTAFTCCQQRRQPSSR